MDSIGGGWARFGKGKMGHQWTYVHEDEHTTTIDVITDSDILSMQSLDFTEFRILTDVQFWLQADDSTNPSSLSVTFLPSLTNGKMFISGKGDHTHLIFDEEGNVPRGYSTFILVQMCGPKGRKWGLKDRVGTKIGA